MQSPLEERRETGGTGVPRSKSLFGMFVPPYCKLILIVVFRN